MATKKKTEKVNMDTITVNGAEYVRAEALIPAKDDEERPFVIVRSYGAGVFAGYLVDNEDTLGGRITTLDGCIRLHQWTGCSLSQVAQDGVASSKEGENRFSVPTNGHQITQVLEVIPCTSKAMRAIQAVETWKV